MQIVFNLPMKERIVKKVIESFRETSKILFPEWEQDSLAYKQPKY
jgi:hypothetical protein